MTRLLAVAAILAAFPAGAANDLFHKRTPDSMNGFMPARDATYVKECGTCHFAYSPGLLPARSWVRQLDRMATGKHFGESVDLKPDTRARIQAYLTANAADVSAYEGSKIFMERVPAAQTPYRLSEVLLFRQMHRVMREIIDTQPRIKVKTLANCNACHQKAEDGSFGLPELYVPGLTGP